MLSKESLLAVENSGGKFQNTFSWSALWPAFYFKTESGGPVSDLLVLAHGEQSWLLFEGEHSIGRSVANSVSIDEKGVSRRHCRVSVMNGVVEIEDLGSRFGTFVNNNLVRKQQLNVGDKIRLGDAFLEIVSADGASESQVPVSPPPNADPYLDPAVTQEQSVTDQDVVFCKACGLPNLREDSDCFACGKPLHLA
jgi:hypothetical protein